MSITSFNQLVKHKFHQTHRQVQLGFTEIVDDKIKSIFYGKESTSAYDCQNEITLDDKYGHHHS